MADTQRQQLLSRTKVPKLRYRNAPSPLSSAAVHSVRRDAHNASQTSSPLPPPSPSISSSTRSPASAQFSPSYPQSLSSASISSDSLSVPSSPYTESARQTKGKAAKDKMTSLFGFFTIKEPSQQAWIDYRASIKKQQTSGRSRSPNVGVPMVSSAKLPSHVPAVNSKWNGLPEGTKERRENSTKERRGSSIPDGDSRNRSFSLHSSRKNSSSIPRRSSVQYSHSSQNDESTMPRFSLQTVNDALHRSRPKSIAPLKTLSAKPSQASVRSSPASPLPSLAPTTQEPLTTTEPDPLEEPSTSNPPTRPSSRASHTSSASATTFSTSSRKPFLGPLPVPPRSIHVINPPTASPTLPDIQAVKPLNNPSEVTLSSQGPDVLPPPFSTRRGRSPNMDGDAVRIPSALTSQTPPRSSILKKSTPGRMGMHHIELPRNQPHTRDLLIAPWPSPGESGQFTFM